MVRFAKDIVLMKLQRRQGHKALCLIAVICLAKYNRHAEMTADSNRKGNSKYNTD